LETPKKLPKRKPRYANPNHPMNAERTTGHPDGVTRKTRGGKVKKYDKGGYTNKDGKDIDIKKFPGMKGEPISPATRKILGVKKKAEGGSMKPVPAGNKGLAKLPTPVRNKMGYAKKGGSVKAAKHGGKMCRGGGAATRGKSYGKTG